MSDLQQRFNLNLKRIISEQNLNLTKIAVAVSGGADSLALAFLLNAFAKENNIAVTALTVNHNLRLEAKEEADYVAELMAKNNIPHFTLEWKHPPLDKGIETKARKARYDLLFGWCREKQYQILATAHHLRDQAETFLMRLQRGSGVDGLAAIEEASHRENVVLLRPLLAFSPDELKAFLIEKGIVWKEDASNNCDDFLRVRVRKALPFLEQNLGLTLKKMAAAAAALSKVRNYFFKETDKFITTSCTMWYGQGWSFARKQFNAQPDEIKYRVLGRLIKEIGGNEYMPEYVSLLRLQQQLDSDGFKGCTLGGCEILFFQNKVWIIKECKNTKILSKQQWKECAEKLVPKLKNELPYKLRQIIYDKNSKAVEFEK